MAQANLAIKLEWEHVERLDRLSQKAGISRHQLMKNIVIEVSKDLDKCNKVGLLRFAVVLKDMKKSVEDWVKIYNKKDINEIVV